MRIFLSDNRYPSGEALPKFRSITKTRDGRPVYYGWWIVLSGSISQGYTSGTFWNGFGAFFDPIVEQFGWSHAVTSGSQSLQRTESGMIAPFVGFFIDKFGPRRVMLGGTLVTGIGFILLSQVQSLWQFYAAFALITVGLSFGTFLVVTTTVTNWFVQLRGRALAFTFAGSALGGILVPAVVWLITISDWRTALIIVGVGYWVVGIPVALVMRSRPEDYGYAPDGRLVEQDYSNESQGVNRTSRTTSKVSTSHYIYEEINYTIKQALKTRAFWQLSLSMGISQLLMSASIHHIPAISSFGFTREIAGFVILGVSIFSLIGRLSTGILGDYLDKRWLIAIAFTCQFIGTLIFAFSSTFLHLAGFIVIWGFGFGASIPIRFALIADYFGRRHYGSIMGTLMTVSTIFGVIGPVLVGLMFDMRGNYQDPFILMSVTVLFSIPLILTLKQPGQILTSG